MPQLILKPYTIDELVSIVKEHGQAGRGIRVAGSGHSSVPIVSTDDVLISLENMQGIESVDKIKKTATILGGTTLTTIGSNLHEHGFAQENLGDIDVQSVAGAISTGTHGTGIRFGILSTQIEELTLITAAGDLLVCSDASHPDIFRAALVSLGTLGIIAKVKFRIVPVQRLHYRGYRMRIDDCLAHLEGYIKENKYFGFYIHPHTPWAHTKFLNDTTEPLMQKNSRRLSLLFSVVPKLSFYRLLSQINQFIPGVCKPVCAIAAMVIEDTEKVEYSHQALTFAPGLPFYEMEYALPIEYASQVLNDIRDCIEKNNFKVSFPVQCRFVRADDIWLSPAYQRDSVYVAVHMHSGMPYQAYFKAVEEIFKRYQGRPHWGKLHTRVASDFVELYPRWNDFLRIREELDPKRIFLNTYLRQVFTITP